MKRTNLDRYLRQGAYHARNLWKTFQTEETANAKIWRWKESESESRSVLSDSLQPHGLHSPWNSPGQNTGVGSLFLFQGIFQTQGWNPGLPHCRWIPHQLSCQGSPDRAWLKAAWLISWNREKANETRRDGLQRWGAQDKDAEVDCLRNMKPDRTVFKISVLLDKLIFQKSL